jgi:hypothetical protein
MLRAPMILTRRFAAMSFAALSFATLTAACSSAGTEDRGDSSNDLRSGDFDPGDPGDPRGSGDPRVKPPPPPPPPPPFCVWPVVNPHYCDDVDPRSFIFETLPAPAAMVAQGCATKSILWFPTQPTPEAPTIYGEVLVLCPAATPGEKHVGLCDRAAPAAPAGQVYVVLEHRQQHAPPCQSGCHAPGL